MKKLLGALCLLMFLPMLGMGQGQDKITKEKYTAFITKKFATKANKWVYFIPRDKMRKPTGRNAALPKKAGPKGVPLTVLPVDCTANRTVVCPMYANDQLGDCGEAMAAHTIGILSFAQGKRTEILYQDQPLISQYLAISGGDNGMDESMEIGPTGVFTVGVGGNSAAIAVDSLDVDPMNVPLCQYLIDQFYTLQLAWSVPDDFVNNWTTGSSWLNADTPNPANGHYVTISDITSAANYTLWTWGGWSEVSQSFVASVQPSYFVVFSPVQFDPATGYDSHGRHITAQAAVWQSVGGKQIAASVISAFPPAGPPPPPPPPGQTFILPIPSQQVVVPGQSINIPGGILGRGRTVTTGPVTITIPAQTVTGTLPATK